MSVELLWAGYECSRQRTTSRSRFPTVVAEYPGGDVAKSANLKKPLSDFGAMGALLSKIEAKTEK